MSYKFLLNYLLEEFTLRKYNPKETPAIKGLSPLRVYIGNNAK